MQELIDKIREKAGITDEQAVQAINAVKEFVTDKFPMLSGAVDNMFAASDNGFKAADEPLK